MLRFFSIIVPAYNEEKLIGGVLQALKEMRYPPERFEVIVVENGSTDATLARAKQFESAQFKIYSCSPKGVSRARNFGLEHASRERDWSIVLDADTILKPSFLEELNKYLDVHPDVAYGMAALTPMSSNFRSRFWFWFRNWSRRRLKTLDTVHIVRRDIAPYARYPEEFNFTEDLQYTELLRPHGNYFFMPTRSVISSTRRYDKQGYAYVFVKDLLIGSVYTLRPSKLKGKLWEAVR